MPPSVARFTGVNKETEGRERRCRRVADQRAAKDGPSVEGEERTHAATGRAQRESESSGKWKRVSPWVVAATEAKPIKVYVAEARVTHHQW